MAFEFGFDVVRVEVEELEVQPDEGREFMLEAMAGDVVAHISADIAGLSQLLDEIDREERNPEYRAGRAWEPSLPQMRGFFFHPRILLEGVQAVAPHRDDDEEIDFWEFVFDGEDGSQVILRLSEGTTRQLARRVTELLEDVLG